MWVNWDDNPNAGALTYWGGLTSRKSAVSLPAVYEKAFSISSSGLKVTAKRVDEASVVVAARLVVQVQCDNDWEFLVQWLVCG